ncbi:FliM/FliN family flagellar motor switch protein [Faecalicatena sp. AGMB00832]|uniref:FliM/FliN family flagellar motor switch protein n=1 Tax=Faecalicatena faecalis TaxID=2726362 RepID=A0ABS6DAT0_9FIRM|nr:MULTISPECIES: FliM/FliN family flagellar motor switch protein [Faecalicatena]MBU3878564.1 FliM/FliN family flagellar motor switch protein [Faecalicatena faecalis]MCI6466638.1 FliM/FliN family flagellar motor switch protein [Faecalicatena sp.]MDY5620612.1 FliM/FliN family flagellar motor switch protein [Lachnospiraceae bacterium]
MIKTYDFKSPKKFTKERMSIVENLYEGFSRSLATWLTGLLQVYCEVSVTKIEECRYQEYISEGEDISMFALMNLIPENKEYNESPIVFEMEPALCFFMIERLLGGQGTEYELDREFTDIEMAIIEHLLKKITEYVQDAWNGYMDIRAALTGMETNSHLLQMSAPEDVILVVEMEVRVKELSTKFYLAMPAANVEELTSKFGFKYVQKTKRRDNGAARRENLVSNLLETDVELRAILHRFELDAQEVMKLQVGDVVPLNKRIDSDIEVMVEDVSSFTAKPGHTKLRKAIQIEKVL